MVDLGASNLFTWPSFSGITHTHRPHWREKWHHHVFVIYTYKSHRVGSVPCIDLWSTADILGTLGSVDEIYVSQHPMANIVPNDISHEISQIYIGRINSPLWIHIKYSYIFFRVASLVSAMVPSIINTLMSRQIGRQFPDATSNSFCCMKFVLFWSTLSFVQKGRINNNLALFQIIVWHQTDDRPYLKQWWSSMVTHIRVTRLQ